MLSCSSCLVMLPASCLSPPKNTQHPTASQLLVKLLGGLWLCPHISYLRV